MKQARIPNEKELKRLFAVVGTTRHAARNRIALMLSYYAGMRVGEIANLKIGDVVDANGQVREQIQLDALYTKGKKARAIFVGSKLKLELSTYLKSFAELPSQDRPFLITQKQTAFSANSLCQLLKELYEKAGVDGASSHSGRRSFITKLAHSGVSAKVIMTLAGHQNLSTTQRYIDVNDEMLKQAVEVV